MAGYPVLERTLNNYEVYEITDCSFKIKLPLENIF
jgi:hypothetical protein